MCITQQKESAIGPPPENRLNQEIQVLRAIAVLAVIVHHLAGLFVWDVTKWSQVGQGLYVGVDLFFCVSGFVIARTLLPKLEDKTGIPFWKECGAFWVKRLYRITPSAWLWLLIPMALGPLMIHTQAAQFNSQNLADIAAAILHVENFHFYNCTTDSGSGKCGVFALYWTLSLEEQFYIALPFIVFFFRKRLSLVLICLVFAQLFISRQEWNGVLSFIRTDAILLGVLIAIFSNTPIYRALEPSLNSSRFRLVIPALLLFSLFATTRYQIVTFYTGLAAVVCAVIVWLCSYDKGYFFKPSPIRDYLAWIGTRSYAIYLIHIPSFWFTREIWAWIEPQGTVLNETYTLRFALTALVLIFLLTELNYRFVEEPIRKRGHIRAKKLFSRQVLENA